MKAFRVVGIAVWTATCAVIVPGTRAIASEPATNRPDPDPFALRLPGLEAPFAREQAGPEHAVTALSFAAREGYRMFTAAAWSGETGLVVWNDRTAPRPAILGARIDGDGQVLDPGGLLVHDYLAQTSYRPPDEEEDSRAEALMNPGSSSLSIAWTGENYLVVWTETRSEDFYTSEVYGARITADGAVLDPQGFLISPTGSKCDSPRIACGSTNCLVTWSMGLYASEVMGARIGPNGFLLDASPLRIAFDHGLDTLPRSAWAAGGYYVAWVDGRGGVYGTRVTESGLVQEPNGTLLSPETYAYWPSVAGSPEGGFLVTFAGADRRVEANRIDPTGTPLDPAGIVVATGDVSARETETAWDGNAYVVAWGGSAGDEHIYGARVDTTGSILPPGTIPIATTPGHAEQMIAMTSNGHGVLIPYIDDLSWPDRGVVSAIRMDDAGQVLDNPPIRPYLSAGAQRNPAVAWDGSHYLVAWEDFRYTTDADVYVARVNPDGSAIDGTGIPVSGASFGQTYPMVAWTGTNYVVVWNDARWGSNSSQVYYARVSPSGQVLDPDGIPLSPSPNNKAVLGIAGGRDEALIVWYDGNGIYSSAVSSTGIVSGPTTISRERPSGYGSVAGNGESYFVAWHSHERSAIYAARLLRGGKIPAHAEVRVAPVENVTGITVAPSGAGFLVSWSEWKYSTYFWIRASRFSKQGKLLDATPIQVAELLRASDYDSLDKPVAGWDGANTTIVWKRGPLNNSRLYARHVSVDGVADPARDEGILVGPDDIVAQGVRAISQADGRVPLVYHRTPPLPPERADRVFLRWLDTCPDPQAGCGIEPSAPAESAVVDAAPAPVFWWEPGSGRKFRVEFSATQDFGRFVTSQKKPKLMTSYVPSPGKWKAIAAIAAPGSPIYWRITGVTGSNVPLTSPVRIFSVAP